MPTAPKRDAAGKEIAAYCKEARWPLSRLAELAALSRSLVSLIVSGRRPLTTEAAKAIVAATKKAKRDGATTVRPLTLGRLRPDLLKLPAADRRALGFDEAAA